MRSIYPTGADSEDSTLESRAGTDFFRSQMSWSATADPSTSVDPPPFLLAQAPVGSQPQTPPRTNPAQQRLVARNDIRAALLARGIKFFARVDWHALPAKRFDDDLDPQKPGDDILFYESIVIHHAGGSYSCSENPVDAMQRAQSFDMEATWSDWASRRSKRNPFSSNLPLDDIGYHYAISCAGEVYEGRPIGRKGEHVEGANTHKLGIVMLTSLFTDSRTPQLEDTTAILVDILRNYLPTITRLGGHLEFLPGHTPCPGAFGIELVEDLRRKSGLAAP